MTLCFSTAIRARIEEYRRKGGPAPLDFARAKGPAKSMDELADTLAVQAFRPGGVDFNGQHWEVK